MDKKIIHTVVEKMTEVFPSQIAVRDSRNEISYEDLNKQANQLAHLLSSLEVAKGDIVGVMINPSIALIESVLSIFKKGGVYLPIDRNFAEARLQQIFEDCKPDNLIVDVENLDCLVMLQEKFALGFKNVICHNGQEFVLYTATADGGKLEQKNICSSEFPVDNLPVMSDKDDANYIFYTSGSTGVAKAILGRNKSLGHFINWEINEFGIGADARFSLLSQFTFDASLRDIFTPLCTGGTIFIPDDDTKNNTLKLLDWFVDNKITHVHCVPSLLRLITKELVSFSRKQALGASLKQIIMAGEALYSKDIVRWRLEMDDHVELVNLYGTSETTMAKTFHRIKSIPDDPGQVLHVGQPISNAQVIILNGNNLCSVGEIGEVYIKTPFTSLGYYNNEALTQTVFIQNPLVTDREDIVHKTGDFGRYLKDDNIEILGRRDDQVKVNGIRVELGEIKEAVLSHSNVEETEIILFKGDNFQNELVCYYVGTTDVDTLRIYLEGLLNRNVIPTCYMHLDEFPLTINGKVDKRALPAPEQLLISDAEYEETIGVTERALELMCLDILGLRRIGRKVSFFKIGGSSLKAMQYISRIYREYCINVKLRDIFEYNSIEKLAAFLDGNKSSDGDFEEIEQVPVADYYELSHAQKRLWFVDQFNDEKLKYNMSNAVRIRGNLKLDVLQNVMTTLIDRHEILRTTIGLKDGIPCQKVHDQMDFGITQFDLTNTHKKDQELESIVNQEFETAFDISTGPLIRTTTVKLNDEEYIVILSMHHIVSDGWSLQILQRECFRLYEAYVQGQESPLKPLRIQYKDFAHWQNERLSGSELKSLEKYWLDKLSGELKTLDLPVDIQPESTPGSNGDVIVFKLDALLSRKLISIAEDNEATIFMLMTTLVNLLMSKYTGYDDIIIGTPAASRNHPDLQNQVGLYINVLPLRVKDISKEKEFKGLLGAVKEVIIDAFEHDLYPYDLLIEKLGMAEQNSRFPLMNVLVQSQDMFNNEVDEIKELDISDYDIKGLTSKVDITFNFKNSEDKIHGLIEYSTTLFRESTVKNILENLIHFAEVVADSGGRIKNSELELLLIEEVQKEQDDFKKTMMSI